LLIGPGPLGAGSLRRRQAPMKRAGGIAGNAGRPGAKRRDSVAFTETLEISKNA